ncbi:MAG: DUF2442 domain-containing protein [Spirochaetaceae bacterium]|jgi:hypothetical protein|nr:DUF2442 domain-containing protein [Spirochaetaceae bacterium]
MHDVVQVLPQSDFTVFVYFSNGIIKKYDASPLLGIGIFNKFSNIDDFQNKCTVLNNTLAWDLSGNFDTYNCIDIDPENIYESSETVADPLTSQKR